MNPGRIEVLLQTQRRFGGWIPWREFMRLALYDPAHGYYTSTVRDIGPRGDFSTLPTRSIVLARAVRAWSGQKRRAVKELRRAPVIEVGAGNGDFALAFTGLAGPLAGWTGAYWIVETSPVLQALQRAKLKGRGIRWFASLAEALRAANGRALLFSNELVDAFPCSRFLKTVNGWLELGIQIAGNRVYETAMATRLPDSSVFDTPGFAAGQRVETHETWRDWVDSWRSLATRIAMLTVDYGGNPAEIYHRRPGGTLRGYRNQARIEGTGLYANFGGLDLTADVNSQDLTNWGRQRNLLPSNLSNLAAFLRGHTPAAGALHCATDSEHDAVTPFFVLEQEVSWPAGAPPELLAPSARRPA